MIGVDECKSDACDQEEGMQPVIDWVMRWFGYVVFKIRQSKQQRNARHQDSNNYPLW
jgi:hypothetical protein